MKKIVRASWKWVPVLAVFLVSPACKKAHGCIDRDVITQKLLKAVALLQDARKAVQERHDNVAATGSLREVANLADGVAGDLEKLPEAATEWRGAAALVRGVVDKLQRGEGGTDSADDILAAAARIQAASTLTTNGSAAVFCASSPAAQEPAPPVANTAPATANNEPLARRVDKFYGLKPLMTVKDVPKKATCRPKEPEDFGNASDDAPKLRVCHMKVPAHESTDEAIDALFFDDPRTPEMNGQLALIEVRLGQLREATDATMQGYINAFDKQYGPMKVLNGKVNDVLANMVRVCGGDGQCAKAGIELVNFQGLRGIEGPVARFHALDAQDRAAKLAAEGDLARAAKEQEEGAHLLK